MRPASLRPGSGSAAGCRERLARVRHSQSLVAAEMDLVHASINRRTDIAAWYCPNAFWPEFNRITAARPTCVPDFVVADFPVAFARMGGDAFAETVNRIERTIAAGDHFVTYSDDVRQRTLVHRFGIEEHRIAVAPARCQPAGSRARRGRRSAGHRGSCGRLCDTAPAGGRQGAGSGGPAAGRGGVGPGPYLFYASQIRPKKNVGTLLIAFHHLVKRRFIGRRLLLTGSAAVMPEITALVTILGLQDDVLFSTGLPSRNSRPATTSQMWR